MFLTFHCFTPLPNSYPVNRRFWKRATKDQGIRFCDIHAIQMSVYLENRFGQKLDHNVLRQVKSKITVKRDAIIPILHKNPFEKAAAQWYL